MADSSAFPQRAAGGIRVAHAPGDHDYNRCLYGAMEAGAVIEQRIDWGQPPHRLDAAFLTRDAEVVHLGWPEHLFDQRPLPEGEYDRRLLKVMEELGASGTRVVWTLHNRRPHAWSAERGGRLYQAVAAIADGVVHHSRWGMEIMRSELAFKPGAVHLLMPHGHYGGLMPCPGTRAEIEQRLGLGPAKVRLGVLGRSQKEKRVETILRAFRAAGREDQQLVVTAYPQVDEAAGDGRVVLLPRPPVMPRELIALHTHACDALVSAHAGESYLTSGLVADAIGAGIGMVAPAGGYFEEALGAAGILHDNTEEGLARVLRGLDVDALERAKAAAAARRAGCGWRESARAMLGLFRRLLGESDHDHRDHENGQGNAGGHDPEQR